MPPYRNRVRARYRPYGRRGWKINQNRIPPGMEPVAGLGFMPGAVNRAFNTYFNKRTTSGKGVTHNMIGPMYIVNGECLIVRRKIGFVS